jgi:plastocyanin
LLLIILCSGIMRASLPSLASVLTTVVVIALATGAGTSIVLFDNLLTANAQTEQLTTNQSLTQQEEEKVMILQGIVTSSLDPLPGHEEQQMAKLLPFRQDGSLYSGVLTYAATEPVEVAILNMETFNETEQATLDVSEGSEFGTLLTQLDNQTSIAISYITPPYGDSPTPSASIPFAGNAVWLHTSDGTPFSASYTVSAEVLPSEIKNNISSTTGTTDTVTPGDDEIDGAEDEDVADTEDTGTENITATDTGGGTEEEAEGVTGTTPTSDEDSLSSAGASDIGEDDEAGANEEVIVRIPEGASELTEAAYTPNPVEVNVGDTVTWINDDSTPHTATSGSSSSGSTGMFGGTDDSPEIIGPEGDTQSFTFDEVGQFEYYCTLHPNMVGTVVVTEG